MRSFQFYSAHVADKAALAFEHRCSCMSHQRHVTGGSEAGEYRAWRKYPVAA